MQNITSRKCVEPSSSSYEHKTMCHQKRKLLLPHHYDQWKLWETTSRTKRQRMSSRTSSLLVDNSQVDWRHERHMMAPLQKTRTAYKNKNKKAKQQCSGAQRCNQSQSDLLEYHHHAVNAGPAICHHFHLVSM